MLSLAKANRTLKTIYSLTPWLYIIEDCGGPMSLRCVWNSEKKKQLRRVRRLCIRLQVRRPVASPSASPHSEKDPIAVPVAFPPIAPECTPRLYRARVLLAGLGDAEVIERRSCQCDVSVHSLLVTDSSSTSCHLFIHFPNTRQDWLKVKRDFYVWRGLPNLMRAIDCTHVTLLPPSGEDRNLQKAGGEIFSRSNDSNTEN